MSVSVCVCQCVGTLTAERIDVRSQNLVQGLTLMTSLGSLMVKVIQMKNLILEFWPGFSVL